MCGLDDWDLEILNSTADDFENLEQIYLNFCFEPIQTLDGVEPTICGRLIPGAPLLSEVANRIRCLVEKGLLEVVMDEEGRSLDRLDDLSYVWRGWFRMTPEGRKVWESKGYLTEQG